MSDNIDSTVGVLIPAQTEPAKTASAASDQIPEVAVGLGGIISLFSGCTSERAQGNLLCENGDNPVQEDGGLILLE